MIRFDYKYLWLIVISLILTTQVYADSFICINSTLSQHDILWTNNTDGSVLVNASSPTPCSFGCKTETGQCNPSPYDIGIGSIGILFSILTLGTIFYIMSLRTDDEIFKVFFHFASLFFFLATLLIDITFIYNLNIASSMGYVEELLWFIAITLVITILNLTILLINDLVLALWGKPLFGKRKKK